LENQVLEREEMTVLIGLLIGGWLFALLSVGLGLYKLRNLSSIYEKDMKHAEKELRACTDAVEGWKRKAMIYNVALIEADIKEIFDET
jgi:hypothetical protein